MLTLALTFAPALLMLAALAAGLRPGERTLLRLRARRLRRPPLRGTLRAPRPSLPHVQSLADRLRAAAVTVRPPPVAAV